MGIPTDGEEKVGAQADGGEKGGTQASAEVALLMDCSSSDLLAIFIFFRKTNSISIRITTVKISPTPKLVAPEAKTLHRPILVVLTFVSSLGCSSDELE